MWADRIVGSSMAEQAVERGLASAEDLAAAVAGMAAVGRVAPTPGSSVLHGELLCSPAPTAG